MEILDPELAIVDPHHHLWDCTPILPVLRNVGHPFARMLEGAPRYLMEDLRGEVRRSGHNVVATVYVECDAFYRTQGPVPMMPVGEVETVAALADEAAAADDGFAPCAAIVGHADLTLGASVGEVLDAHVAAGRGRFRGVRHAGAHDEDGEVLGFIARAPSGLFADPRFREGFAELGRRDLVFDAWVLEPQIPEVTDLARAFPDQRIVLDHVGTPVGIGRFRGRLDERFSVWRREVEELAGCPNVVVKLGGLSMPFCALGDCSPETRLDTESLAELYRPYVETCIEAFGAGRAMFESNFPVDGWGADYATIWNAFKLISRGASGEDRSKLFAGTAAHTYGLELPAV